MRYADRRFGFVDVLTARARRTISVHFNLVRTDFDVALVLNVGHYVHGRKRRLSSRVGVERRNTDEPVNTLFRFKIAVSVFALDFEAHRFKPRAVAVEPVVFGYFVAVLFRVTDIHSVKHFRPVARFRSARSGVKS